MSKKQDKVARHVLLIVIGFSLFACTVVVGAIAQTAPTLSKKEVKTLLATAKTPADQEQLAAYYRDKAKDLRAKAQEFAARAESMQGLPAVYESKQGIACQCAFHYRYFSQLYRQEAKDADTLAAQHEQLAHSTVVQQ
jgi:hypothetical protein